ncbi:hypothetical protein AtEden1_Chr1g0050811 [Arabidopsis thaliana]
MEQHEIFYEIIIMRLWVFKSEMLDRTRRNFKASPLCIQRQLF